MDIYTRRTPFLCSRRYFKVAMSRHTESRDNIALLPLLHLLRLRPLLLPSTPTRALTCPFFSASPLFHVSLSRPRNSLQEQDSCRPPISRTRISPLRIFNFNIFLHRAAFTNRYIITYLLPRSSGRVKEVQGPHVSRISRPSTRIGSKIEKAISFPATYCTDIFYVSYFVR